MSGDDPTADARRADERRPLIGVTTSLVANDRDSPEQRLDLAYVRAVEAAGGLPLPVPMLATDAAADAFAALLDGLVVTGGPAVTRGMVGARPADLAETLPERTASDERLLRRFLDAGRPALGICYGMQLASALRGGTIWADAERDRPDTAVHGAGRGGPDHDVRLVPGSHTRSVLGADVVRVGTRHVQAVRTLGAGLAVSGVAPDGVVEAVETPGGAFVGVQFHPEALGEPHAALFRDLVARAAVRAAVRAAARAA